MLPHKKYNKIQHWFLEKSFNPYISVYLKIPPFAQPWPWCHDLNNLKPTLGEDAFTVIFNTIYFSAELSSNLESQYCPWGSLYEQFTIYTLSGYWHSIITYCSIVILRKKIFEVFFLNISMFNFECTPRILVLAFWSWF